MIRSKVAYLLWVNLGTNPNAIVQFFPMSTNVYYAFDVGEATLLSGLI